MTAEFQIKTRYAYLCMTFKQAEMDRHTYLEHSCCPPCPATASADVDADKFGRRRLSENQESKSPEIMDFVDILK